MSRPAIHSSTSCDFAWAEIDTLFGCQEGDFDVLRWLGVDGLVDEVGYDVKSFNFQIPEEGSTHVSASSGIFFDRAPGPHNTGISQIIATSQRQASAGQVLSENMGFPGLYAQGGSQAQHACTYCRGRKEMNWPWGTISEPKGFFTSARDCFFQLTGGNAIEDLSDKERLIIIKVDNVDLERNETLIVGWGAPIATFRQGSHAPVELHLPIYAFVEFSTPGQLSEGAQWIPLREGVRFKVTYKTIILTGEGRSCQLSCFPGGRYDEACVRSKRCADLSREISLDGADHLLDLKTDFGNDGVGRRTLDLGLQRMQGTEQQPQTVSSASVRNNHPQPNRLAMSLSGYGGANQEIPCKLAQNSKQILMNVEQVQREWDGIWTGQCAIAKSCSSTEETDGSAQDCLSEQLYESSSNTCSVDLHISDNLVREYRYNCGCGVDKTIGTCVTKAVVGVAIGYIIRMSELNLVQSTSTDVTVIAYRRFAILYTKSTLQDREVGVEIEGLLSFGTNTEFRPENTRMQIMLGTSTGAVPGSSISDVDAPNSLFSGKYGACRAMLFRRLDSKITLVPNNLIEAKTILSELLSDAVRYRQCNETLKKLQTLEQSLTCKQLLDDLLYRDVKKTFVYQEGTCENPCFKQVRTLLQESKSECSRLWKEKFSSDVMKKRLYKKLYVVALASTYANMVCDRNHKGERCITKSISDFAPLFQDCPIFLTPTFQLSDAVFVVSDPKTMDKCPQACYQALER
jgi:hypothetical protein